VGVREKSAEENAKDDYCGNFAQITVGAKVMVPLKSNIRAPCLHTVNLNRPPIKSHVRLKLLPGTFVFSTQEFSPRGAHFSHLLFG